MSDVLEMAVTPPLPRLLALDLDGTLLRHDGSIDPVDIAAIRAVQAIGVRVSVVTGRLCSGVREVAERAGIRGLAACADGAELVDLATQRVVRHRRIQGSASRALWGLISDPGLAVFLMTEDHVVFDARGAPLSGYVRSWAPAMEQVENVLDLPHGQGRPGLAAVVAVGSRPRIDGTVSDLRADGRFEVARFRARGAPGGVTDQDLWGLLAHASGVDKGRALVDLARLTGVDPGQVVAVGDWLNDIPMLRAAGRGFAMGGVDPAVLAAATDGLCSMAGEGGGVAEAIATVWNV